MKNTYITKQLQKLVKNSGLLQNEFAKKAGIKPPAFNLYYLGKRKVQFEILEKIAKVGKVDMNYFSKTFRSK